VLQRIRARRVALLLALVAVTTLGDPVDQSTSRRLLQQGPHAVGSRDVTLVDTTRPTAASGRAPGRSERTLATTVWYPARNRWLEALRPSAKPLAEAACACPLVIYSHGFMSFRKNGAYLAKHLASHGYLVAAADFPLTHFGTSGGPQFRDLLNQPGDVSFLIDTLLAWSENPDHRFAGSIDRERIGAVGLSLGGLTTTLLAFHPSLGDARVRAAVSIAGPSAFFDERFFATSTVPFLMIAGDIDAMVDYSSNAAKLRERAPAATLITLRGGSHTAFAGVATPLLGWLSNPDSVGCWAIGNRIDQQVQGRQEHDEFITALGGEEAGIRTGEIPMPCRGSSLPPALRPQRQHELTTLAVFSFLQSQLHSSASSRVEHARILAETLARENPEMDVSTGRLAPIRSSAARHWGQE